MAQLIQDSGVATSFGSREEALNALETGAALTDLSHWTRLRLAGRDRLTFLHNQVDCCWNGSRHKLNPPCTFVLWCWATCSAA